MSMTIDKYMAINTMYLVMCCLNSVVGCQKDELDDKLLS